MLDHSFTLQAILDLKNSVAQLSTKTDRLIEDVREHKTEITGISRKINLFLGGAVAVGAVAGIMLTIAMQIPWARLFEPRNPQATGVRALEQPPPSPPPKQ